MATTIMADWKLEETCGRIFGVCYIEFSPPYDKFDFAQGFTLTNPTSIRCALQSIIIAAEAIKGCAFLQDSSCIVLATKHDMVFKLLSEPSCVRKWINGTWPKTQRANKTLLTKAFETLESLDKSVVTFVSVERDPEDKAYVDLDEGRSTDGIDIDTNGKKTEQIEAEMRDIRMRGVMAQKLFSTGAKCYRKK